MEIPESPPTLNPDRLEEITNYFKKETSSHLTPEPDVNLFNETDLKIIELLKLLFLSEKIKYHGQ